MGSRRAVAVPVVPPRVRPVPVRVVTSIARGGFRPVPAAPEPVRLDPVATDVGWRAPTTPGPVPGLVRRWPPVPEGRQATARCRPVPR
ncbi:RNA polymerase, sigma-24 subunit, ECF subfamily [Micromonospora sp. L5]|nr:RNA polymerase, sigma-24 subunit, ECF subfamily [Micromonospora sp. L5]